MSDSSDFFGSYHERFPQVVTEGIEIDPQLFTPEFSLPIRPFNEPDDARQIRLAAWHDLLRRELQANPDYKEGEYNGLPALYQVTSGGVAPKRFANPLWTQDNPIKPTCFFKTDWTYFNAAIDPEYFRCYKRAGILPPLMAGIHLESPDVPLQERPADKMGRPGEKHPPSCAMREPNHFYCASQFLLNKYLGALGFDSATEALRHCRIVLRQIHAYNPDQKPERPHLTDYCLQFKGGIERIEP